MKVLLLNGSPRKGNTRSALEAISEGMVENLTADVELIDVAKYRVDGCLACEYCSNGNKKCVNTKDDGQFLVDKIEEADVVIFGTPVYWWGITAQLKAVIDRIYMKKFPMDKKSKKIGIIAIGAAELEDKEYTLISEQFKCICDYIGWDLVVDKSISAAGLEDVKNNLELSKELKEIWRKI